MATIIVMIYMYKLCVHLIKYWTCGMHMAMSICIMLSRRYRYLSAIIHVQILYTAQIKLTCTACGDRSLLPASIVGLWWNGTGARGDPRFQELHAMKYITYHDTNYTWPGRLYMHIYMSEYYK